ncbi:hypothetical protein EGW08_013446 [Elysia chlorotica]|uniref:Uncharacterized protein n=1 Tax=Elysia chlorotica TaxID=188477 RepID=A0A3S0ZH58_ELYCH|nr:hypothetical protein EGW08_013446 [Elysia chlorotica]
MNVVKLLADGSQEAVPSAMMSNMFPGESFRTISWPFQAEKGSGDGDGITSFQCSAFDESHDKEVSKVVDVLVLLDDGIDDERSNVTVSDDEMNPDIKYITFTCVVYGRPLPEVTFSGGTNYIFYMDSDKPDELIKTSQNEAKAIKTVTLDMAYLRKYNYEIYEDDESPYCGFHSRSTYEYIEHKFQLPDLGLED